MEALKTIIKHTKHDVRRRISRMAVNTAKMFEQTSRDAANPVRTAAIGFSLRAPHHFINCMDIMTDEMK